MNHGNGKDEKVRADYDVWHAQFEVNLHAEEIWHKEILTNSDPKIDIKEKTVLEIGCGRGGFALWIARQSWAPEALVAADFSDEAVRQGRAAAAELGVNLIDWQVQDIMQLSFEDGLFDTVISCETIEHVPDPKKAVRELARVLRPGGRLLLTTPNYMNLFGLWRIYRRVIGRPYKEAGQPINRFVMLPRTLSWVRSTGLEVEKYGSAQFVLPRFRKPPAHFHPPKFINPLSRFLGLQSWLVARKPETTSS